jgi:hypothetical protein
LGSWVTPLERSTFQNNSSLQFDLEIGGESRVHHSSIELHSGADRVSKESHDLALEASMKTHPPTPDKPIEDLGNPNDDGCVLGTAGRNEDPNATTDWDKKGKSPDHRKAPNDARGLPGYPHEAPEEELGIETPEQDNDKVG